MSTTDTTTYATHKFYCTLRGVEQTHELWLPLDLTPEEADLVGAEIRKLAENLQKRRTAND